MTIARATATRCCWPPDSSDGTCLARSDTPTRASAVAAREARSAAFTPAYASGSSTLLWAVVREIRLKLWKTKPILRLRTSDSWRSLRRRTSIPSSRYRPEEPTSRHPMMFIRVDLPEPDAPMMAT